MSIEQKKKILSFLARKSIKDEDAQEAIQKEFTKVASIFVNETKYANIDIHLELLDVIAYRVSQDAVKVVKALLERLDNLTLEYDEIPGFSPEDYLSYQSKHKLMVRALEVLERIRYYHPSEVLDIFFEYSIYPNSNVSEAAVHGVTEFAKYDKDIFYGDGKDWPGLGWGPQEKVLEKISSIDQKCKLLYLSSITAASEELLSPTISGTSSNYKTFTFHTGAIPAEQGIKEIRKKTLKVLQDIYSLTEKISQKKAILNIMDKATSTPHMGKYGDDLLAMIIDDTIHLMKFMKQIAASGELEIMQKIEHDAYWIFKRNGELSKELYAIGLEIRDSLIANEEYQIYRILIGYESIFHDWEKAEKYESYDYEREREFREQESIKLAESVDNENYEIWKGRILLYASIESNDMATFPYFAKFLEQFGKHDPSLALRLVAETSDQLEAFIVPVISGVFYTESKEKAYSLIEQWCEEEKHLFSLARCFEFSPEVNENLLSKIFEKAVSTRSPEVLNQIISSASAQYNKDKKSLIEKFFIPCIRKLTEMGNSNWIFNFWFRAQRSDIVSSMDSKEHQVILDNLLLLKKIDYQAEEVLSVIAESSPELVINFFCKRLLEEDKQGVLSYDAVPYDFYKLSEPLSKHPVKAVEAVLAQYNNDDYALFVFRGAQFLKNIFPNLPQEFEEKLLLLVKTQKEENLLFVMAILKNYNGSPLIYNLCKEIVKILPKESKLMNELVIILESTGVVTGEYGFVIAYEQKIREIESWVQDKDAKVQEFARNYIKHLEKLIDYEQKRADEEIALRKHHYGSEEE